MTRHALRSVFTALAAAVAIAATPLPAFADKNDKGEKPRPAPAAAVAPAPLDVEVEITDTDPKHPAAKETVALLVAVPARGVGQLGVRSGNASFELHVHREPGALALSLERKDSAAGAANDLHLSAARALEPGVRVVVARVQRPGGVTTEVAVTAR